MKFSYLTITTLKLICLKYETRFSLYLHQFYIRFNRFTCREIWPWTSITCRQSCMQLLLARGRLAPGQWFVFVKHEMIIATYTTFPTLLHFVCSLFVKRPLHMLLYRFWSLFIQCLLFLFSVFLLFFLLSLLFLLFHFEYSTYFPVSEVFYWVIDAVTRKKNLLFFNHLLHNQQPF